MDDSATYAATATRPHVATKEDSASGVSWGSVLAGAFGAAALSVVLMALGTSLGLTAAGGSSGPSAKAIGIGVMAWLIVVQWLSAAMGGYLAGRLRTKWVGIHTDEVFFRDTAHGFLAWAVGAVISTVILSSAVTSAVGNGAQAASSIVGGVGQAATQMAGQAAGSVNPEATGYFVDQLFRSQKPAADTNPQAVNAEATRIVATSIRNGDISDEDKKYLAQMIASRTGVSQADAEKRVGDVVGKAKQAAADAAQKAKEAAETARQAASYLALATCLSMAIGALMASVAGAIGGRQRDVDQGTPIANR